MPEKRKAVRLRYEMTAGEDQVAELLDRNRATCINLFNDMGMDASKWTGQQFADFVQAMTLSTLCHAAAWGVEAAERRQQERGCNDELPGWPAPEG